MGKLLVFSLFVFMLVAGFSETSAECKLSSKPQKHYSCYGGEISDLDKIGLDAAILTIEDMNVTKLPANALNRFGKSLARFQCSSCSIEEIEPGAFRSLSYLQQLILDNNKLTKIKSDWISGLRGLTYFDLSYNEIENIEDDVYLHIPDVTDLRLSGNRVDCINTKALSNLKHLRIIYLAEIKNFKCPRTLSNFLKSKNINFEPDQTWEATALEDEEKFLGMKIVTTTTETPKETRTTELTITTPVNTSPLPLTTARPQHLEVPKSGETLAPKMTTEDIYIPDVLTTNSLPKTPSNYSSELDKPVTETVSFDAILPTVEVSSEIIDASSVVTPISEGSYDLVTATVSLPPATQIVPIQLPDTTTTTVEPIEVTAAKITEIHYTPQPPLPPISGPKVAPTPGERPPEVEPLHDQLKVDSAEHHTAPTQSSPENAAGANRVNEYLFGIIFVVFSCSFFVRS